jgi:zinc protease
MDNMAKKRSMNKLFIALIVLALPLSILIIGKIEDRFDPKIPTLAEQPTDTQVAKDVLPLHHWKSDSGTKVYFVPTEGLPIVDIRIALDAGSARDGDKKGTAKAVAMMLEQGTQKYSASQIAENLDILGARYYISVDRDQTYISIRSLNQEKKLNQVTELVAQLLANPTFPKKELAQVKQQMMSNLMHEKEVPDGIAHTHYYRAVYGDHPYAFPVEGTEQTVQNLSTADLQQFHQRLYVNNNVIVTIVGGIHRDKAKTLAKQLVANLKVGEKPAPLPEVAELNRARSEHVDFSSQQTHVLLGQPGRIAGDPDMFPLIVGNHVLGGGGFNGRLMKVIREDKGLAYDVRSSFESLKKKGTFTLSLQTQNTNANKALRLLKDTLENFVEKGPEQDELTLAKQNIVGSLPLSLSSNAKIAGIVSEMAFYNLPHNFLDTYAQRVEAVTIDDVKDVFAQRIHPSKMVQVTVGGDA